MSVNRLRNLCDEIYETINKLYPEFMSNIFKIKENKIKENKRLVKLGFHDGITWYNVVQCEIKNLR